MNPLLFDHSLLKIPSIAFVLLVLYFIVSLLRSWLGMTLRNAFVESAVIGSFTLVGAKLTYLFVNRGSCPLTLTTISGGGISSHGAVVGGLFAIWFLSLNNKQTSFLKTLDTFAPLSALTYCIFRWGCYLTGCCWGVENSSLPWGVVYPQSRYHPDFHVSHPVQLYDSFLNFLLFLVLWEKQGKERFIGESALMFFIGNSLIRFFTDYFRWGASAVVVGSVITQAQIASLVIILGSLIAWRVLSRRTAPSFQLSAALGEPRPTSGRVAS